MNDSMTELKATQRKQEYTDPASNDHGSDKDSNVHHGPAGTTLWAGPASVVNLPGVVLHPHQHTIQPGMVDPLSLRFHCPCQAPHCQLTYPDYLLEPQLSQYHLLTGPECPPPDSGDHSSLSAPWFTEPILCSTMPVVCNVSGGEQVLPVNPWEPEPVFLTLKSAPQPGDDGSTQGKGVSVLGTPIQYHQAACPLYESRDQTADVQPQAPTAQTVGTLCESKSRKRCHCSRSQCLKLYCDCFANGVMCSNCDCTNCHNNTENEMKRDKAIKSYLGRNPDAFRSIADWKSGEVKGWRNKGCNCKRSGCLKNYCECYEANIKCTSSCKCDGCRNYDVSSEMGLKERSVNVEDKWPVSVITPGVVEAVCGCLLVQAEKAEREAKSPGQAERMVLEEFGHCLTQIVNSMFKENIY